MIQLTEQQLAQQHTTSNLAAALARLIAGDADIGLQPSAEAYTLAAAAALNVLLAHNLGAAAQPQPAPAPAHARSVSPSQNGAKKLRCPQCPATFKTNGRLNRHIQAQHPQHSTRAAASPAESG